MPLRARLTSFARWCARSLAAAIVAGALAGLAEGIAIGGMLELATAVGFIVLAAVPVVFALSLVVRSLWRGWQPGRIAEAITEDGGGMPVFAGWLAYVWSAAAVIALAAFGSTHLLAATTQFRPMVVGFLQPMFSVVVLLVLVAISRPAARGLACLVRRVDRRWRARGWSTLLAPGRVVAVLGLVTVIVGVIVWMVVSEEIGHLEVIGMLVPLVIGFGVAIAFHWCADTWRATCRWLTVGATLLALGGVGAAGYSLFSRPALTLTVWAEGAVSGVVVDQMFDLDRIRDNISLDTFRPVARSTKHPDLILITIDTVRADRTPPYGGKASMPFLAGLAERGAVFEWAFAPSNVTRRSIPSMITGLQPNRVRGRVRGWALRMDPRHVLLAERLRAGGYQTAGFMCCESFWGASAKTGMSRGLEHVEIQRAGALLAKRARTWLDVREKAATTKPLFVWVHILDPHNWPGAGPEPANIEIRRQMYDRSLVSADKMIAGIVGAFGARDAGKAPIVVVTADHGEALGDHDQPNHSTDLYNSQIRVPLVITGAGIATTRISETVSLTDLTPTLLELAGFAPPDTDGRSFAPLATGAASSLDPAGGVAFAAMIKDRSNPGGKVAIVVGTWKLIVTGERTELYNVATDPDELDDVSARFPDKVATLRAALQARLDVPRPVFAE